MLREHGTNQTRAPAENDNTGPNVLWTTSPLCTVSVGTRSPTTPQTRCTQCIQRRRLRAPRKTLSLMSGTLTNACSRCAFISLGHSSRCLFVPSTHAAPRHTGARPSLRRRPEPLIQDRRSLRAWRTASYVRPTLQGFAGIPTVASILTQTVSPAGNRSHSAVRSMLDGAPRA